MTKTMIAVLATLVCYMTLGVDVAAAASNARPLYNGANTIIIGRVYLPAYSGYREVVCYDAATAGQDSYYIYDGAGGLTQYSNVYGDLAGGSGNDVFVPVTTVGYTPAGYCDTGGGNWTSGTWEPTDHDIYGQTYFGVGGLDTMNDGGGTRPIALLGDDDGDTLTQFSSNGSAWGLAGNDELGGYTAAGDDTLYGGTGSDCLYDADNSATVVNCGNNGSGDRLDDSTSVSSTGCPGTPDNCW